MSNGLHLELVKKDIQGHTFSQGILTLEKAGDFTVQIKEYEEARGKKMELEKRSKFLVDPIADQEEKEVDALLEKFKNVNWVWSTVSSLDDRNYSRNPAVTKGIDFMGKTLRFPNVLEGGGFAYVEAFFENDYPTGNPSNGILIRANGTPKIRRVEWTDREYNPIGDNHVAFGSQLILHVYTEGLYGQEILVGLKDVLGANKDLKIDGSEFFDVEVRSYPVKDFEDKQDAIAGLMGSADNPKQQHTNVQKAEIPVNVDRSWMFGQSIDLVGNFGRDIRIKTHVYKRSSKEELSQLDDSRILKVSLSLGKKYDYTEEATNNPVLVGNIDTEFIAKEVVDFTFGIFLDGTLNNMYDTELRQYAEGRKVANASGLSVSKAEAIEIHKKKGSPKAKDSSYENDLSNPAIIFKSYLPNSNEKVFRIYTEGIGTNTAPQEQGALLKAEDYKKNDMIEGPAFGKGSAGIRDNVKKAITDAVKELKKISDSQVIGSITFDVFGFSRGAAAARHFVHLVTHGSYIPIKGLDLQKNTLQIDNFHKVMPQYGPLGQLLAEADLLHDTLTKVKVRFVGIYDTVPHHGLIQSNDNRDLGLDNVNKADYVVHMVAADEHRGNFDLSDISSVNKASPDSGLKGGMELIYPGVHCDVGGSYEEGTPDNPKRIDAGRTEEFLEPPRNELIKQGWFKEKEITIIRDPKAAIAIPENIFRLEGKRARLSNQYSYIPLHIMAQFCSIKNVPIEINKLLKFKRFHENMYDNPEEHTLGNHIIGNVEFLERIKKRLEDYTFHGAKPFTFVEPGIYKEPPILYDADNPHAHHYNFQWKKRQKAGQEKLDAINDDIKFLRNHYLHWNSTYGNEGLDIGLQTNHPNKINGKRKRNVH